MTSLFLPAPRNTNRVKNSASQPPQNDHPSVGGDMNKTQTSQEVNQKISSITASVSNKKKVPSYSDRCNAALEISKLTSDQRKSKIQSGGGLFVPRCIADFEDGGAFPEIHVAQYPRNMGNPHLASRRLRQSSTENDDSTESKNDSNNRKKPFKPIVGSSASTTRAIVPLSTAADGSKDYTSILTNNNKNGSSKVTVYAKHHHLKPHTPSAESIQLPSGSEITTTAQKTAEAFQSILQMKTSLAKPSGTALANASTSRDQESKTEFLSYKPNPNAPGYNPTTASQRVIRIVPKQLDPMMPPKHKHVKAPRGPEDGAPPPVLHAPPEKLSKEEREKWNVPACVSNWKNTRGYTIPLDKRLAADGRGCREDGTVNSNFATLSESLYLAEREAREEVRVRALVRRRQAEGEREKRERELRELAMRARLERGGGGAGGGRMDDRKEERRPLPDAKKASIPHIVADVSSSSEEEDNSNERQSTSGTAPSDLRVEERDKIRQERRKELVREMRMERRKPSGRGDDDDEDDVKVKKARLEGDRDISEKIALGVHKGTGALGGTVDSRLYNQNAGFDSGFGAEDEYNTYTKPMFDRSSGVSSSSIYRPTRGEAAKDADEQYEELRRGATSKFQADVGFSGAEGGMAAAGAGAARSAPVQFEKSGKK